MRFNYMFVKICVFLVAVLLFLPALAMGQTSTAFTMQNVYDILNTIVNWFFAILIVLGVMFIFVAAFYYLTAGENAEKVKKAHTTLTYALVAIAISLLAKGIVYLVSDIIGKPVNVP